MITDYITLHVNGEAFNCLPTMSLRHLLLYLEFDISSVAVEYNGEIVPMDKLEVIILKGNDVVEVITIVGGG
uniref:Thiamine biosynthesis protein S n=1 Tax=Ahnfeltia plicata TaxID=28023 RepID=A0A1C9CB79_9FLOR|nr:thiamine biosynthesis protein S [Ahnfeltia plicata]AOM65638.1 thiamine biosynthesis protein S [Ahnfeltia plicata]UAT97277.1 thiamine biosynthesis protein S [Ahnfeltia plicata]UAT97482.1 thiamine biosynthesis protein S [Ahnfeltia plicata]